MTGEIKITAFGSSMNGLWNSDSDIDITAIFINRLAHNQHQLLKMCSYILKDCSKRGTMSYIPARRVPILKFIEQESGIEVDFNVNNVLGIHNSELIYKYCEIDQRFHIMAIFLKYWSKQVGIIGASLGLLSSYALTLMLIAFLQSTEPPVLPCLQEKKLRSHKKQAAFYPILLDTLDKKKRYIRQNENLDRNQYCLYDTDVFFETDIEVIKEKYLPQQQNNDSVPELLFQFFYFYLYRFDQENHIINVKDG